MADLLVYGSYGYTGRLVVEEAVSRGLDVVVAGRDRDAVENQAIRQGCTDRVFGLDDERVLDLALQEVPVVLNCAGPFVDTYRPVVEGCLRTGTHYLDVTGEIQVFEAIAGLDDRAREEGVQLLPGVGFDVVPTDCLAAHLAERVADAMPTHLALGFLAGGGVSPGTARTMVRNLGEGGAVRRDGVVESVPTAWRTRRIDFGDGEKAAMTIPWGDVSTAYHTTGIENVEVYAATPPSTIRLLRAARYLAPLLGWGPVGSLLERVVDARVDGPDEKERENRHSDVWGEVETDDGRRAVSRLRCPNTYRLTKLAAVGVAERVVDGEVTPGFRTPADAYGADLVFDVEGVERTDEPVEEVEQTDEPVEDVDGG